jgi:hypothetical protein
MAVGFNEGALMVAPNGASTKLTVQAILRLTTSITFILYLKNWTDGDHGLLHSRSFTRCEFLDKNKVAACKITNSVLM